MVGAWKVKPVVGGMPEKVATAFTDVLGKLVGAEYTPIAYLGSQVVNGVNHAILAEQLLVTGKDTKNVVLIVLNEREEKFTIANIERVVEGGDGLGGTAIDVKTEIPAEAKEAFDAVLGGNVGTTIKPFALLATQVTKGINYVFAAKVSPVVANPEPSVEIVFVNALTKRAAFVDVLKSSVQVGLGKPLGEWP